MSSKAGYLKTEKTLRHSIGDFLQKVGHGASDFLDNPMVERGFGAVGSVLGKVIPIPIVGSLAGKEIGQATAKVLSSATGLVGEIGGLMSGNKSIVDVLTYLPLKSVEDIKNKTINHPVAQMIRGELNWRDAIIDSLEENAMIDFLAPNKEHAWKDQHGNYHKRYVDGAKMVVGEWVEAPNSVPRPNLSSNEGILGVHNGEILYKGFDDERWNEIQQRRNQK